MSLPPTARALRARDRAVVATTAAVLLCATTAVLLVLDAWCPVPAALLVLAGSLASMSVAVSAVLGVRCWTVRVESEMDAMLRATAAESFRLGRDVERARLGRPGDSFGS